MLVRAGSEVQFRFRVSAICVITLGCLVGYSVPSACVAQTAGEPAQLTSDSRLSHKVTVDVVGLPVAAVLRKVSDGTVDLSCGRNGADLKLQVHLVDKPLSSLMESLAELLPGTWESVNGGKGYRLVMTPHAVAERETWWRLFLAERERAYASVRAGVLSAMRAAPRPQRAPGEPNPESSDPTVESRMASEADLFRALPSTLQEKIAERVAETPFDRSIVGFGSEDDEGVIAEPLRRLPPSAKELALQRAGAILSSDPTGLNQDGAYMVFRNGGIVIAGGTFFPDGRTTGIGAHSLRVEIPAGAAALLLDHRRLAKEVEKLGRSAPESWKRLAGYQNKTVWQNAKPTGPPGQNILPVRRDEVLSWFADKAKMDFVADYYSKPGVVLPEGERAEPPKDPFEEELNRRAAETDTSWKRREDGVYLFRDNRWYRDDRLEVPSELLDKWMGGPVFTDLPGPQDIERVSTTTALRRQLDWELDVVRSLTRFQIGNGLKWAIRGTVRERVEPRPNAYRQSAFRAEKMPFFMDSDRIMLEYHTVQFYASLTSAGRSDLLSGRLRLDMLTPEQAELAAYLLPQLGILPPDASRHYVVGLAPQLDPATLPPRSRVRVRLRLLAITN